MRRSLILTGVLVTFALSGATLPRAHFAEDPRCTMATGDARLVVRVEEELQRPLANARLDVFSLSTVRPQPGDPPHESNPLMRTARVRVLLLDSVSRATLTSAGIRNSQPTAYLQAFTYGADCRPVAWRDTQAFVQPGERGYAVAALAPRSAWIDDLPVFVVTRPWEYPYPRRRDALAAALPGTGSPASPEELFEFDTTANPPNASVNESTTRDSVHASRVLAWARTHRDAREHEPMRTSIRDLLMSSDMTRLQRIPSRVRGTYRVTMQTVDTTIVWWFRTVDKPAFRWRENDEQLSTSRMLEAPFASYTMVGYAVHDSTTLTSADLGNASTRGGRLVWLSADDRPSLEGNAERRTLKAQLMLRLPSIPEAMWPAVVPFSPSPTPAESLFAVRLKRPLTPADRQPALPITLRFGRDGALSADTVLEHNGRRLRVLMTRIDTIAFARPW